MSDREPHTRKTLTSSRCSHRKHFIGSDSNFCDCGQMMIGQTAARNAQVVTLFVTLLVMTDAERGEYETVATAVAALREENPSS